MEIFCILCSALFALVGGSLGDNLQNIPALTRISVDRLNETISEFGGKVKETESGVVARDKNFGYNLDSSTDGVERVHELDNWIAPYKVRKLYAYYHAGFDDDGRPIWIGEVGKWNFRAVTENGENSEKTFEKYLAQAIHRMFKSIRKQNRLTDHHVREVVVLLDFEDFKLSHVTHVPTIRLILRMVRQFRELIDCHMHAAIVVNANAATHTLVNIARPILGRIMEKTHIYGTNRAKWLPQVLKLLPKDQIPQWYGGIKNFTPVNVYG